MSATSEVATAVHTRSLADLPTERVAGLYSYAHRMWVTTYGEDELYYLRMLDLTIAELQSRDDPIAASWRASFVG